MTYNNWSNFTNLISFSNVMFEYIMDYYVLCIIPLQLTDNFFLEKAVLTFKYNYILFFYY